MPLTFRRLFALAAIMLAVIVLAVAGGAHAQNRLAGLPLVELPTTVAGDTLAVIYSGDGGWAAIDKGMADTLGKAGIPTVGVNALRYFWTARTPLGAAADLSAIIDRYKAKWGRHRVLLIGYSFGADALPIIVANMAPDARAQVRTLALVGTDPQGELHFRLGDLLNQTAGDAYDIAPVLQRLKGMRMVCVYGDEEKGDACPTFPPSLIRQIKMNGGHHFGGDYDAIAKAILGAMTAP